MKIKITRKSKSDIPNYRDAGKATTRNCGTCSSFSAGNCSKYSASVKSSYVCNTWIPDIERVKSEAKKIIAPLQGDSSKESECGFKVYKEASGELRWLSISSTSFKDRDRQYMSQKGLEQAVAWNDQRGEYGPLRFWHLDGVDIGDCDFSMMHGKVLLESGTFRKKEWGESIANNPDIGGVSIGFKHPENEPKSGVFENFLITERSIMPRGKESNLFTGFTIKENDMNASNLVKISSLVSTFGEDEALKILESAKAVEKDAEDQGHTFKESFDYQTATPDEIIAYGELKKKEAKEAAEAERVAAEAESKEEEVSLDVEGLKELIVATVKEAIAAMIPAEKETVETEKEAGPDLLSQIETLKKELKELKGDAPRANGSYRASTDSEMKTGTKAADETPISDVDRMAKGFAHPYYGESK